MTGSSCAVSVITAVLTDREKARNVSVDYNIYIGRYSIFFKYWFFSPFSLPTEFKIENPKFLNPFTDDMVLLRVKETCNRINFMIYYYMTAVCLLLVKYLRSLYLQNRTRRPAACQQSVSIILYRL